MSSTAGELITETLDYHAGRQVTAYVPAAAPEAVVFAGDGQLIASWGQALETGPCWQTRSASVRASQRSNQP